MGDDQLSASELRNRYGKNGSVPDNELTSSQLRARHAIPSNSKDFSTRESGEGSNAIILIVFAVIVFAGIMFYMTKK